MGEEGAFKYLVVSEDSDTEFESEDEVDTKAAEALKAEQRKRVKDHKIAAMKKAEKRMAKHKEKDALFAKKNDKTKKYATAIQI